MRSPRATRCLLLGLSAAIALLGAGPASGRPSANHASAARAPVLVGVVQYASGGHLSVHRKASGATGAMRAGGRVYLGDVLLVGRGVEARFKLTTPPGYSTETELLLVKPVEGSHPKLKLQRSGRSVEVNLSS